jgi:hypothetical protein
VLPFGVTRRQLAAVLTLSGLIAAAGPVALLFKPVLPYPCLTTFKRVNSLPSSRTRQQINVMIGAECAERRNYGEWCQELWYGPGAVLSVWFTRDGECRNVSLTLTRPEPPPNASEQLSYFLHRARDRLRSLMARLVAARP